MLFLGAGASKAVDIGDLKDLTDKVNAKIISRGYGKLLDHIQDTLKKANSDSRFFNQGETDIEVVFSILNSRTEPVDALKNLGPYSIYINELREQSELPYADQLQNKEEINNLKETIEKVIVSQCNKFKLDKATKYYDDLFRLERDTVEYRLMKGSDNTPIFSPVVTTNYDLVLERYSSKTSNKYGKQFFNRGFVPEQGGNERYLPLDKVLYEYPHTEIKYLKLHGSIDWWFRDRDQLIVERDLPRALTSLTGEKYRDRLMVYPIYEKYVSKNPFFALYNYFRKLLHYHFVYVVIGYSFRDPAINNAFHDSLVLHPEKRIIIINPYPENIQKRIQENFPMKQVTTIARSFGQNELLLELEMALQEKRDE
jgi:hypothetical protein